MKVLFACITVCLIALALPASAKTYEIAGPSSLESLDHEIIAVWGIDWELPRNEVVVAARIKFENLYNYDEDDEDNILYVNLLDTAPNGVVTPDEPGNGNGNYFQNQGEFLGSYHDSDGPRRKSDKNFWVRRDQMSWLADGNFGFGIDPDCHFYNCGVKIKIWTKTQCVPEPASFGAFACGLIGLTGVAVRRRRSR